MTLNGP